ncbi:MAG: hypothetical protein SPE09_07875 [Alloprevotella sp.]|nr:hypothetical protein [Alloprevotella sp.]
MKQLLTLFLCGLFVLAAPACAQRTIQNPKALGCLNVSGGELKASKVVFADTATTVQFTMDYPAGSTFRIAGTSYLVDENNRRYLVRSAEGLTLDAWVTSPADRTTHFTLHFEPLPKRTRVFDFIEYDGQRAFMLLGIHDSKQKLKMKTMEELAGANAYPSLADWFTTDSVTLRGRIEGYSAEAGFPTQLEMSYKSVFDKDELVMVADIRPDGTFEKRWEVDYPKQHSFRWDKALPGMKYLEVFARPGDTINVTVRRGEDGLYRCIYHDGSSQAVERWLKSGLDFRDIDSRMYHCEGTPQEAEALAEELWQLTAYRLQTEAARHNFTPTEMQLAVADAQVQYATGVMDYALAKRFNVELVTAADSAVYATLRDTTFYSRLLHRIDFDNPLLMASGYYDILLNRIQYAWPVLSADGPVEITDEDGPWDNTSESILKEMEKRYATWRGMMGSTKNNDFVKPKDQRELARFGLARNCTFKNLMAQMCNYQEMLGDYNMWRENESSKDRVLADPKLSEEERKQQAERIPCLSNVFPRYVSSFTYEALRHHAEQFHAARQAMASFTSPLPQGQPAQLIRSLQMRYPGRYLVIDFWGMGCGPCRGAIQSSKELRAEIAKRDDVKLVFIAGEETAEGSEAYHKYVKEWLADEETICIPDTEFSRLQEYFRFNGIPHYETITPDGRIVGEEYRINGLYNFKAEMERLIKAGL